MTVQTATCCVPSFWHNTGVWRTDRQTDGIAVASTALAMRALRHAVTRKAIPVGDCGMAARDLKYIVPFYDVNCCLPVAVSSDNRYSTWIPQPQQSSSVQSRCQYIQRKTWTQSAVFALGKIPLRGDSHRKCIYSVPAQETTKHIVQSLVDLCWTTLVVRRPKSLISFHARYENIQNRLKKVQIHKETIYTQGEVTSRMSSQCDRHFVGQHVVPSYCV